MVLRRSSNWRGTWCRRRSGKVESQDALVSQERWNLAVAMRWADPRRWQSCRRRVRRSAPDCSCAAAEDLDDAIDFAFAAHQGIELGVHRGLGQVTPRIRRAGRFALPLGLGFLLAGAASSSRIVARRSPRSCRISAAKHFSSRSRPRRRCSVPMCLWTGARPPRRRRRGRACIRCSGAGRRGRNLLPDGGVCPRSACEWIPLRRASAGTDWSGLCLRAEVQQQMLGLYIRRPELAGFIAREKDDAPCFLRVTFEHIAPSPELLRESELTPSPRQNSWPYHHYAINRPRNQIPESIFCDRSYEWHSSAMALGSDFLSKNLLLTKKLSCSTCPYGRSYSLMPAATPAPLLPRVRDATAEPDDNACKAEIVGSDEGVSCSRDVIERSIRKPTRPCARRDLRWAHPPAKVSAEGMSARPEPPAVAHRRKVLRNDDARGTPVQPRATSALLHLDRWPGPPTQEQRSGHVLQRGEFGEQIVKLPHKPDFPIAKIRGGIVRQRTQLQVGEVYVTLRKHVQESEDMQQVLLARTRFAGRWRAFLPSALRRTSSQRAPGPTRLSERPSSNFRPATSGLQRLDATSLSFDTGSRSNPRAADAKTALQL